MKTMKKLTILASVTALAVLMAVPVIAAGPSGPAGASNTGLLYLFEKDPSTWVIVPEGAWGKLKYNLSGPTFNFVFNGHKLMPTGSYTLIYYPDPWPGSGLICLETGTADQYGDVHIARSVDTGSLPATNDYNNSGNANHQGCLQPSGTCIENAKIWLVLSSDVNCGGRYMTGWHPTEYLFEFIGITYKR